MKHAATAAEKRYMGRVAELPCAVCGAPGPSAVHHIREGQGGAQRAPHWLTVPLCPHCHQGPQGIHGDRSAWRLRKLSELDALADTIRRLA
jgi:hypothetical protein